MKQKKVKFTFIGLFILILAGIGWLIKGFDSPELWIFWMTEILGLITVFTIGNSKDKKERLAHENKLDESNK